MLRKGSVLILSAALLISACSGDGQGSRSISLPPFPGGSPNVVPPNSAPPTSGLYVGPFTGSLMQVGAVSIDYRGCDGLIGSAAPGTGSLCIDLLLDGKYATVDRIDQGTIVEFSLDLSHGLSRADMQHAVIGPVENVSPAHANFTVLGQTVYATNVTAEFGSAAEHGIVDLNELSVGDDVTVSGYFSNDGQILATLVQRNVSPQPPLMRGVLTSAANGTFRVGELELDLSGASVEKFPGGTPLAGDTVLVQADQPPLGGVLRVTTLSNTLRGYQPTDEMNVTGFATAVRANSDFDIGGIGFQSDNCHECGLLDANGKRLLRGRFISVTRTVDGAAHLSRAWLTGATTGLVSPIEAIDIDAGSITVLGFTVQVTPGTYIDAGSQGASGLDSLGLSDLAVGNNVAVTGGVLGQSIVADQLSLTDGVAQIRTIEFDLVDPAVVFLGRNIQTDASTLVLDCTSYTEGCAILDTSWLFKYAALFKLVIYVDTTGSELRATRIDALSR